MPNAPLERFAESRLAAPAVFAAALVVYGLVSLGLPLQAGRDLARYLLDYAQLFDAHVVFPNALLARTPGTPLVTGVLLEAGPVVAETGAAILYAPLDRRLVLRRPALRACRGPRDRRGAPPLPGLRPALPPARERRALRGRVRARRAPARARRSSSRRPRAPARSAWASRRRVYARPVGQVLVLLGLVPLLAARGRRARLAAAAAFAAARARAARRAGGATTQVRGDDFTVVRGGSASLLFRTFVADRIVEPGNGAASEELARAVARELLPNEPYRSRGIDLETFFSSGSSRMHDDLTVLADRTWGWDDDYRHLGRVAREAILAHPTAPTPAASAAISGGCCSGPSTRPSTSRRRPRRAARRSALEQATAPPPTDGEPIPSSREAPYISTPDGRIREVWTSPTEHSFVFRDPADARSGRCARRGGERAPRRSPDARSATRARRAS